MRAAWVVLAYVGWAPLASGAQAPPAMPWPPTPPPAAAYARAAELVELGQALFFDTSLSASGRMSCASCHDPAHGFAAPNAKAVQIGGADMRHAGIRAVPSLMYQQDVPPFTEHFFESEDEGDESVDQGPTGGRDWDGRVDRARDQAALPLLDPNEMANPTPATLAAGASRGPNAAGLRRLFGQDVLATPARALAAIGKALEYYQQTSAVFSPFSSKYDAYLKGQATLTASEAAGLAVFNDPDRGNCAQCHKSAVSADGNPPLFTDFGYAALGLPRNADIPANNDPNWFDMGLCGPVRHDLAAQTQYCGMFKTPTLRNVALKQSFYHNGVFHVLRDAVAFYAQRDSVPAKWYRGRPFNDLPPAFVANVTRELPFAPHSVLSEADVDNLVAFLTTLTDGYHSEP